MAEDESAGAGEHSPMARDSSHTDVEETAKNKDPTARVAPTGERFFNNFMLLSMLFVVHGPSAHPRMSGACSACSPSPIAPSAHPRMSRPYSEYGISND